MEARRRAAGVDLGDWLTLAQVTERTYWRLRRGQNGGEATLRRLAKAIGMLANNAKARRPEFLAAQHRACMAMLATFGGLKPELVVNCDFSVQRPANGEWLEAARIRRFAIWVMVLAMGTERVALARALGCTRQNIHQAIGEVEALREADADTAALTDRVARLMTGHD